MSSPCASIWFLMNGSKSHPKLLRLVVSVPTSILSSTAVRMLSTWGSDHIPSMSLGSTKCCPVLELIGSKLEWEVLLVSLREPLLVSTSVRSSCPSVLRTDTRRRLLRLWGEPSSSTQEDRRSVWNEEWLFLVWYVAKWDIYCRSMSARSGVSPNGTGNSMRSWELMEDWFQMESMFSTSLPMDLWLPGNMLNFMLLPTHLPKLLPKTLIKFK